MLTSLYFMIVMMLLLIFFVVFPSDKTCVSIVARICR